MTTATDDARSPIPVTARVRRVWPWLLAIAIVVCVSLAIWQQITLRRFQAFIEVEFAREIAAVESAAHQWGRDESTNSDGVDAYELKDRLVRDLRETLRDPIFFCASWSYDGHHGARNIKPMPEGYGQWDPFGRRDQLRKLFYGKSLSGRHLLIYEMWLPDAPEMQHMQLVFARDRVMQRIAEKRG